MPLQESFAEPYVKTDKEIEIALKKHGQNLTGDMIPMREIQESELKSEHKTAPSLWRRLKRTGKETTSVGEKIPLLGPVVFGRRNKKNYDAVAMEEAKGEEEPLLAEDGKTE